jgi:hypothetical protein
MSEHAFPQSNDRVVNALSIANSQGMTLRDYFAAKAMPVALKTLMHDYTRDYDDWFWEHEVDNAMLAELSYEMADAMLKARTE